MVDMAIRTWWAEGHPLVDRWTHDEKFDLTWVGRAANAYYRYIFWLRWSWWSYVLAKRDQTAWGSWLATAWCRMTNHRGEIFYNPGGLEPDHRCKGCGETIG